MKNIIIALMISYSFIAIQSCTTAEPSEENNTENYDAGIEDDIISHELEMERLKKKELENPGLYLQLDAEVKKNLKGDWILKGTLENKAKEATFENIKLVATFFDKEGNVISTSDEVMNSPITPSQTNDIKFKLSQKPAKAKRVEITIKKTDAI